MPEIRVGLIGLGAMGRRFARRLLETGFEVHAYNRAPARAPELDALRLHRADSPAKVAEVCDVVLMMLWDSAAVSDVVAGPRGLATAMRPGTVVVDLSTIGVAESVEIAAVVASAGGTMVDCPVSGSLDRAESGTVLIMAGGSLEALDRVRPILQVLAERIEHAGDQPGSGLAVKVAINLQVAIQLVGWGESLAATDRSGIPVRTAARLMLESVISSPMLRYRVPFTLDPPDEVWASVDLLRKDVEYAQRAGADGRATRQALELLQELVDRGEGHREAAALVEIARARAEQGAELR